MKRCRRSLPTPNAAAMTSGGRLSGLAIGGMIAGMKGLGTAESRLGRACVTLRRTAVAVATAAVLVGVGSRVNRPVQAPLTVERPRVADEVLADVRLDDRLLASLVDSIN